MAGNWQDKFNILASNEISIEENKVWKFSIEENKSKGTLQMNIREFKITESYSGPTKNGFIKGITCKEDIAKLKESFNSFFEEAERLF